MASIEIEDEETLAQIIRAMRVVAVVGMKRDAASGEPAYLIPQTAQAHGIRVIPVNPKIQSSLGEKAYVDLASVPEKFDTVNVFRRSEAVEGLAGEILALPPDRRPAVVWMQSGIRNEAGAKKLSAAGIQVVMDRCLGVYVSRYLRK